MHIPAVIVAVMWLHAVTGQVAMLLCMLEVRLEVTALHLVPYNAYSSAQRHMYMTVDQSSEVPATH